MCFIRSHRLASCSCKQNRHISCIVFCLLVGRRTRREARSLLAWLRVNMRNVESMKMKHWLSASSPCALAWDSSGRSTDVRAINSSSLKLAEGIRRIKQLQNDLRNERRRTIASVDCMHFANFALLFVRSASVYFSAGWRRRSWWLLYTFFKSNGRGWNKWIDERRRSNKSDKQNNKWIMPTTWVWRFNEAVVAFCILHQAQRFLTLLISPFLISLRRELMKFID